jgi:hypothetical protein
VTSEIPPDLEWFFPFDGMDVGSSFWVPTVRPADMIYSIDTQAKRNGMRMKCYVVEKDGCMGVRAWRVA